MKKSLLEELEYNKNVNEIINLMVEEKKLNALAHVLNLNINTDNILEASQDHYSDEWREDFSIFVKTQINLKIYKLYINNYKNAINLLLDNIKIDSDKLIKIIFEYNLFFKNKKNLNKNEGGKKDGKSK